MLLFLCFKSKTSDDGVVTRIVGSSAFMYFSPERSAAAEITSKQKDNKDITTPCTCATSSFVGTRMMPLRGDKEPELASLSVSNRWINGIE
jgi:hypothetical protein